MNTLEQEMNRIKSELADLDCKIMFGMSCSELVQKIYADVVQRQETNGLEP